jgi:hypothetical protein
VRIGKEASRLGDDPEALIIVDADDPGRWRSRDLRRRVASPMRMDVGLCRSRPWRIMRPWLCSRRER